MSLTVRDLVAGYEPGLPIVRGASLAVARGEIVVLLGPNGAGKSTLVRAVAGLVPAVSGRVSIGDADVTRMPAHLRVRAGAGFVPQTENVFATLTVADNLALAAEPLARGQRAERIARMLEMFPDLAAARGRRAGRLSGGQRQMLAVARALLPGPSVLLLDEPSAGLSPRLVGEVFARLRTIRDAGVAILLVEQRARDALAIADRALVLVGGQVAHEGAGTALLSDRRVVELYLGAPA